MSPSDSAGIRAQALRGSGSAGPLQEPPRGVANAVSLGAPLRGSGSAGPLQEPPRGVPNAVSLGAS